MRLAVYWDFGAVMDVYDGWRSGGGQGKKPERSNM